MKKLLRFLKGYRLPAILGPIFKLMEALFELIIPLVVAKIIDVGIAGGDTAYIVKMGGLMLLLGALGLGFSLTCQYLAAKASIGFGTNVRGALYRHINKLSFAEIDKFGTPSLTTRLTSDINQAQTGVAMFIRLVLRAPFIAIGAIVMAMMIDFSMSLVFIIMALVMSVILWLILSKSAPYYRKIQKKLDRVATLTRENLTGSRVVRAFSNQQQEEEDFKIATNDLAKTNIRVGLISGLLNPLSYAVINLSVIFVLWLGGKQVYAGNLSQGQIAALVNYLSQILLALVVTAQLTVTFTKSAASANRITEVFETLPMIKEGEQEVTPLPGAPKITFNNVSLSYGTSSEKSLKNISFTLNSGETVGIIGSTGSGKSSIVSLIPRFYDATEGEIMIDGVNIRQYPFNQLRAKVGLVPQKASVFTGSIRENICWGKPDANDGEILQALTLAQAADFVLNYKNGLDEHISQGGKNLSGGQKQRLTIARALISSPEILILDDSSSALDYTTDAKLRAALKGLKNKPTVIMVSQREASIRHADKIIVMEDGAMAAIGTHDYLLKNCAVYREICLSQESSEVENEK